MKHLCIQCSFNHWHKVAACKTDSAATVFPGLLADFVQLCLVQGFFQDFRIAWFHCLFEFSCSLHSRPQNHGFRHNWLATLPCFLHAICNFSQASCAGLKICHKKGDHKTIRQPGKTKTPGVAKTIWWNSGCTTLLHMWSYVEPASPRLVSHVFFWNQQQVGTKEKHRVSYPTIFKSFGFWLRMKCSQIVFVGQFVAMITSLKKTCFKGQTLVRKTNLVAMKKWAPNKLSWWFPNSKNKDPFQLHPASFLLPQRVFNSHLK